MAAYVGLGGNLGDTAEKIRQALQKLDNADTHVAQVSSMYETAPLAGKAQPPYLNAVAKINTKLSPQQLFGRLVSIENVLGRVRNGHWQSRTIDLDLLLYDDKIVESPGLAVPHRQMHLRSFVLRGMCEIAPDFVHPQLHLTMQELAGRLNGQDFWLNADRPQLISIAGVIGVGKTTLALKLAERLKCDVLHEAYSTNPHLPAACAGDRQAALASQLYFLDSRREQMSKPKLTAGKPVVSDYVFAKDALFANRTLDAEQLEKYNARHREVEPVIADPVLALYMKDDAERVMKRIKKRSRPYEQTIREESIRNLAADYDELFAGWKKCPVITLDASEFNCMDSHQVDDLAAEIRYYICER